MKMSVRRKVKILFLQFVKLLGGFELARQLTRDRLRILAYHGVALTDEYRFNPLLFIKPETFKKRMEYLQNRGFKIIPLSCVTKFLQNELLPQDGVVITFDDGWYLVREQLLPILKNLCFPFTIYVTTYYVDSGYPVFNVLVRYLIWKTPKNTVDLPFLKNGMDGQLFELNRREQKNELLCLVLEYIENLSTPEDRLKCVATLADKLGFDSRSVLRNPVFRLISWEDIKTILQEGGDVQLHTHRHHFPISDPEGMAKEIVDNQRALESMVSVRPVHFCYPSGLFSPACYSLLEALGVETAVTCEAGLVGHHSVKYALPRFLDGENISWLEFEAEMMGVLEIMRIIRSRFMTLVSWIK